MVKALEKYLIQRTNVVHIQFFRYIFVGGTASIVDASCFYIVNNIFHLNYLIAQTVGFSFGLIVNYLLSILWVFESKGQPQKEFAIFALVGVGGLLWSYFILWLLISVLDITQFQNMLAKAIAVALVLVWNFTMRKKFAFNNG